MSDCKIDPRKPRPDGYVVTASGYAHRDAWAAAFGPIPAGQCVLPRCDVRNCIEPSHLFLGSKGDNNTDRAEKGRTSSHNAKLSQDQVIEIRARAPDNSQRDLAREFGVSQRAIGNVVRGETYV